MLSDDDLPRPVARFTPLPMDRLGVAELQAYIATLQAEMARAKAEIIRKDLVRSAADGFFRKP